MTTEKTNPALKSYIDSLEISKVSWKKLFISDPRGRLAIEVSARGKNAFAQKRIFDAFNTTESELEILIKEKFPDTNINQVLIDNW